MARNLVCSECGGVMREGYIIEHAHYNQLTLPYWVKGRPKKHWFFGIQFDLKEAHYMMVYRCERCGFLKFYAGPDHPVEK